MIYFIAIAIFDPRPKQWSSNENEEFVPPNLQTVTLPSEKTQSFSFLVNHALKETAGHVRRCLDFSTMRLQLLASAIHSVFASASERHETRYILKRHCDAFTISGSAVSAVLNIGIHYAFPFRVEYVGAVESCLEMSIVYLFTFLPSLSLVLFLFKQLHFLSVSYFSCPAAYCTSLCSLIIVVSSVT